MSFDSDIAKLQEQLELLKKQKEENEKNKINLDGYLDIFETIEQIDNEIEKLCTENLSYYEIKRYANLIYSVNENNNQQPKMNEPTKLLNIDILNVFNNFKELIKLHYENKKINIRNNQPFEKNNTDIIIIDKMFKIINVVNEIKKTLEKDKNNIYKCYHLNRLNHIDALLNKYQSKFNVNNIIELDISKIINELDDDINIIKMFYIDAIIFIKQKIKLLSGYPENYEQIVQTKIIELNKKKFSLV